MQEKYSTVSLREEYIEGEVQYREFERGIN